MVSDLVKEIGQAEFLALVDRVLVPTLATYVFSMRDVYVDNYGFLVYGEDLIGDHSVALKKAEEMFLGKLSDLKGIKLRYTKFSDYFPLDKKSWFPEGFPLEMSKFREIALRLLGFNHVSSSSKQLPD